MPKPKTKATEVLAKPENDRRQRRRFSAEDKERILTEADAITERGELGELLRREGIYSSHLSTWRKQRDERCREGLAPLRPGPKPSQTAEDRRFACWRSRLLSAVAPISSKLREVNRGEGRRLRIAEAGGFLG